MIETIGIQAQPRVIGLDLSLTSTGVACNSGWAARIRVGVVQAQGTSILRLRAIRARVLEFANTGTDLVVVEGPAYRGAGSETGHHERAGLWWFVMEAIDARCPWVQVPPATLKKYATGKGNAGKDEVLAAVIKRFSAVDVRGNDEADALVLAAMGADALGHPMVDMPAGHRSALDKVVWPG